MDYRGLAMKPRKKIALVAHDNKKRDLLEWAAFNRDLLARHELYATGTTGRLLRQELDLEVIALHSGPLGGDQQIGGRIAEGDPRRAAPPTMPSTSSHHHRARIPEVSDPGLRRLHRVNLREPQGGARASLRVAQPCAHSADAAGDSGDGGRRHGARVGAERVAGVK